MLMNNIYTLEINQIVRSGGKIFDFDYPFYYEPFRKQFEYKFIKHYYFHEIGQETLERFKLMLQSKLIDIMPYFIELYKAEVQSKKLEWWNNKDYRETYTKLNNRNGDENSKNSSKGNSNSTSDDVSKITDYNNNNSLSKFNDTPQGSISNLSNYLTNATEDTSSYNGGSDTTNNNKSQTFDNRENENYNNYRHEENENFELIGKGNIGVTSSAQLFKDWIENGLINIDLLIFKELDSLFLFIL